MKIKNQNKPCLHVEAVFNGFRRSKKHQNCNQALLKLANVSTADEAVFYIGKKVIYETIIKEKDGIAKKKKKEGTVIGVHGKNGVVRAKFSKNLNGQAIGKSLKVMLWPSYI